MTDQIPPVQQVRLDHPGPGVARITIDNQTRRNALTQAMWDDLIRIALGLRDDPAVRAVILCGAGGRAFSSGADITEFQAIRSDPAGHARYNQAIAGGMAAIDALPMPVIAQIDGACVGGGMALAAMCDLRFMDEGGRIGIPAGKLGVAYLPDWVKRITDIVGVAAASEIFLTAQTFPVETAARWQFAHAVLPVGAVAAHAEAEAARLAGLAPLSLRAGKLAVRQSREFGDRRDWQAAWDACRRCDDSNDYKRGVEAFMAGRMPRFEGN